MFNQLSHDLSHPPAQTKLSSLLARVPVVMVSGPVDVDVRNITSDSRDVVERSMFVALRGEHLDGHRFVQRAIESGASVVVVERRAIESGFNEALQSPYLTHNQTVMLVVEDTRKAFATLADAFYGSPSRAMQLIGITGTNGKTTTSYLIRAILEAAGHTVGVIGTLGYRYRDVAVDAPFTTPLPDRLHSVFRSMLEAGCTSVVMEVSSHALALHRVHGVEFDISLFTNLTQDHLDFHGSMEAYRATKKILFERHTKSTAIFNRDDASSSTLAEGLSIPTLTYGTNADATIRMQQIAVSPSGTTLTLIADGAPIEIRSPLIGRFNAYNLAAAASAGVALNIDRNAIGTGLSSVDAIDGRFERIVSSSGATAIVDYSHTPDSLRNCLETIRDVYGGFGGRIVTVFGCGGDRDRGKRPVMGSIAKALSDFVFVTSDNPRSEDPQSIVNDILKGIQDTGRVEVILDRTRAIEAALSIAGPRDVVLVAGKGHETYQIVGAVKSDFDDRSVIREFFTRMHGGRTP